MLSALRNLLFTCSFYSCKHHWVHSWTFKNKLMRFDTFSIQSFLPLKQMQGEFPATHKLQNQFCATFIPWLDALALPAWCWPACCSAHSDSTGSFLEWSKNEGRCCAIAQLAAVCFQISFKLLNIIFLYPGLILQLKLFCLALIHLSQRHSLEQWRFTKLFFLPTPPLHPTPPHPTTPPQRSVLRYQSDWDCWCTISSQAAPQREYKLAQGLPLFFAISDVR